MVFELILNLVLCVDFLCWFWNDVVSVNWSGLSKVEGSFVSSIVATTPTTLVWLLSRSHSLRLNDAAFLVTHNLPLFKWETLLCPTEKITDLRSCLMSLTHGCLRTLSVLVFLPLSCVDLVKAFLTNRVVIAWVHQMEVFLLEPTSECLWLV